MVHLHDGVHAGLKSRRPRGGVAQHDNAHVACAWPGVKEQSENVDRQLLICGPAVSRGPMHEIQQD